MLMILNKPFLVSLEKSLTARDLNLLNAVSVDDHNILDVSTLLIKAAGCLQCQRILMRFQIVTSRNVLIFVVTSPTAVSVAYSNFCITESQIDPSRI